MVEVLKSVKQSKYGFENILKNISNYYITVDFSISCKKHSPSFTEVIYYVTSFQQNTRNSNI